MMIKDLAKAELNASNDICVILFSAKYCQQHQKRYDVPKRYTPAHSEMTQCQERQTRIMIQGHKEYKLTLTLQSM